MAPRFIQRLERQAQAYRTVFGEPQFDPPPYPPDSRSSSISGGLQQSPPPQYSQTNSTRTSSLERWALPGNSLILVTGVSGFQGFHVADQLLAYGFRVRGTVRDSASAAWTSRYFKQRYGFDRYMTSLVPDMATQGAFDLAVKGCSGVVHCASIAASSPDPTQVITPSIAGAISALEAAENEILVERFVLCSSTTAAVSAGSSRNLDVTSDSWNMLAFQTAWQAPPYEADRIWAVHAASKLQTEQTAWAWYRDHRPHFAFNSVSPGTLWGRILVPKNEGLPTSVRMLKAIWDGNITANAWPPQHFVDVQDSATLHIAALLLPDIRSQRIFATCTPYSIDSVLHIMRSNYSHRLFRDDIDHTVDMAVFKEAAQAEQLLHRMGKKGFTDIETSITRTCEAFV